jgi:SAM-dependent methyltransferase
MTTPATTPADTPAWPEDWAALYDAIDIDRQLHLAFYTGLVSEKTTSLLDLGCGTGSITLAMADRTAPGARVVGVDLSPKMIDIARARAPQHEWAVGDICAPPTVGRFDLVTVCFNTLQLLLDETELTRCFRAVASRLAPNGRFAFDIAQPNPAWLAAITVEPAVVRHYTDPIGRKFNVVERDGVYDPVTKVLSGAWDLHDAETGEKMPIAPIHQHLHQYFPDDIERLVAGAGLRLEARFGDLDRRAFAPGTRRQVCICTLA